MKQVNPKQLKHNHYYIKIIRMGYILPYNREITFRFKKYINGKYPIKCYVIRDYKSLQNYPNEYKITGLCNLSTRGTHYELSEEELMAKEL